VGVPCERHEDVRENEQTSSLKYYGQKAPPFLDP
jgi:hypothetical protein